MYVLTLLFNVIAAGTLGVAKLTQLNVVTMNDVIVRMH